MGHLAYLEVNAGGKQHARKPWLSRCVQDGCRKGPRDMVKAGLPETRPPAVKRSAARMTPGTGGMPFPALSIGAGHLPRNAAPCSERCQAGERVACVVLDTYSRDVSRDHLPARAPR